MFTQALGFLKKMSGNAADEGIEDEEGPGVAGPSAEHPIQQPINVDMEMGYDGEGNGQEWEGEDYMEEETFQGAGEDQGWSLMTGKSNVPDYGAGVGASLFKESLADSLAVPATAQMAFVVENVNLVRQEIPTQCHRSF